MGLAKQMTQEAKILSVYTTYWCPWAIRYAAVVDFLQLSLGGCSIPIHKELLFPGLALLRLH